MIKMRVIEPPKFNKEAFRKHAMKQLQAFIAQVNRKYDRTVKTWDHKPTFKTEFQDTPNQLSGAVIVQDKIFEFVSEGTPPHDIVPVRAKALAFPRMFTPKTMPGVIDARPGATGGDTVFAKIVHHPGTKPRHFDDVIAHDSEEEFSTAIQKAIDDAVTESGHEFS